MDLLIEHVGKGFMNALLLSMPVVLVAAGIGLVVGILQAVTQVQEQTIAAAPKILGVFLVIMLFSGFFMKTLNEFLEESFDLAFRIIPKQDNFVLPASGWYDGSNSFFDEDKDFSAMKRPDIKQLSREKVPYAEKIPHEQNVRTNRVESALPNIVESRKINSKR